MKKDINIVVVGADAIGLSTLIEFVKNDVVVVKEINEPEPMMIRRIDITAIEPTVFIEEKQVKPRYGTRHNGKKKYF